MNIEEIQKIVSQLNPDEEPLDGTLQRCYDEWFSQDQKIRQSTASQEALPVLESEKCELERNLANKKKLLAEMQDKINTYREQIQKNTSQKYKKLENQIAELSNENIALEDQISEFSGKSAEAERLRRKLNLCTAEEQELQQKITGFSEDSQKNIELACRMKIFIEKLESLARKMSDIMVDIWGNLKNDSFDKMC